MKIVITVDLIDYVVDDSRPILIAIPLDFIGNQPNVHGVGRASSKTQEMGRVLGDVTRGGSCNWQEYTITPHSHGTHTECIGHITQEPGGVHQVLNQLLIPITLITVTPVKGLDSLDTYFPSKHPDDLLITCKSLEIALRSTPDPFCQGVVIRTLPNDDSKLSRNYQKDLPPFFSKEAMEYLVKRRVEHLLVDFPSLDRSDDGGHLLNHRLFWNMPMGRIDLVSGAYFQKTVTELIYVPQSVPDGQYVMNLQIPCFASDAAPSRPLLFRINQKN